MAAPTLPAGEVPAGSDVPMLVDDTHAVMERRAFERLMEYSCTLPSGTYLGKRWRKKAGARGWLLGEYVPDTEPGMVGIRWRTILVVSSCEWCAAGEPFKSLAGDGRYHLVLVPNEASANGEAFTYKRCAAEEGR